MSLQTPPGRGGDSSLSGPAGDPPFPTTVKGWLRPGQEGTQSPAHKHGPRLHTAFTCNTETELTYLGKLKARQTSPAPGHRGSLNPGAQDIRTPVGVGGTGQSQCLALPKATQQEPSQGTIAPRPPPSEQAHHLRSEELCTQGPWCNRNLPAAKP